MPVWLLGLLKEYVSAPVLFTAIVLAISLWADWRLGHHILSQDRIMLEAIRKAGEFATRADQALQAQQTFLQETVKRLDAENDRERSQLLYQIRRLQDAVFPVVPHHHSE